MERESLRSSLRLVVTLALFLALVVATGYRIQRTYYMGPRETQSVGEGFCDFFNGVYYPTIAFWSKENPYTPEYAKRYPVDRQVPPFSPLVFGIHTPFAWLARDTSAAIYFAWLVGLTLLLSALTLTASHRRITVPALFFVASFILISRSGQVTVFNGYFTLLLVIGAIVALHYADEKPWLSGAGLALASCKPTFAIPLVLLMLAKRNVKATLIGVGLSAFFLLTGLGWLATEDSVMGVTETFLQSQDDHRAFPNSRPLNTWNRVDLLAVVSKWFDWQPGGAITLLTMLGLLAAPCGLLFSASKPSSTQSFEKGSSGILGLICMLALLVSVYHQHYDALLLVVPISAMLFRPTGDWKQIPGTHRVMLACLISAPLLNYLSARSILDRLGLAPGMLSYAIITSVNGICLSIALLWVAAILWQQRSRGQQIESVTINTDR